MDGETFQKRTGLSEADLMVLKTVPLFSGLDRATIINLLADSSIRRYPRGTTLFLQDDPVDRFCVVFEGWVKLYCQSEDGFESVVHVAGPCESFAEAIIFDNQAYPFSAEIAEDARLLSIPKPSFLNKLKADVDICLAIMGALSQSHRYLVQTIEQMASKSSVERLAVFLESLCGAYCNGKCDDCELHLPIDKGLIAGRLNMQPETLSRSLVKLRDMGVKTKGNRVMVADMDKLRAYAHGSAG